MRTLIILPAMLLLTISGAYAEELPDEAEKVIKDFERAEAKILRAAEEEIKPIRQKAVKQLKALQDKYCRAAKLDEALAIREAIRQLRRILPDPGYLRLAREQIGRILYFEVTGSNQGQIWGSEVYTSDSHLGTAAVHAGVLRVGKKGVIKVRVLPGQNNYQGSVSNGIKSLAYGAWGVSFTVESSDLQ